MTAKLSLSWLNLILILLLMAVWLGIWAAIERQQSTDDRLNEPRADEIQLGHAIPGLQSKVSAAQGELTAIQAKLLEQRLQLVNGDAELQALAAAYPALQTLGINFSSGSGNPNWLEVRLETLQGFAQARADLDATSRFMKALETAHVATLDLKFNLERSSAPLPKNSREVSLTQGRQAACADQLEAIRKKLAETHVELAKRQTAVDAMVASNPRLASLPADVSPLLDVSSQGLATLWSVSARHASSESMTRSLEAAVADRRVLVAKFTAELIKAERAAAHDLDQERKNWDFRRRIEVLRVAFWISLGVLVIVAIVHWGIFRKTMNWPNRALLGAFTLGALIIIDAYQVFEGIGASFATLGMALLIVGLLASMRIKPSVDPGVKDAKVQGTTTSSEAP